MGWTMILFVVAYAGGVVGGCLVGMSIRDVMDGRAKR